MNKLWLNNELVGHAAKDGTEHSGINQVARI